MFKQRGLSRTDFPDEPQGRFREDLLYRLNVFTIKVPPLRKRTGDIRLLAQYFVDKYSQKIDRPMQGLSQEVLQCLENYPFPGNVRELENELERAVALAQDVGIIEFSCLSEKIVERSAMVRPELNVQGTLKEMVEALEKSVLSQLLEKHGGNRTRAAKELGLSRYGLMKKTEIWILTRLMIEMRIYFGHACQQCSRSQCCQTSKKSGQSEPVACRHRVPR